MKEYIYTISTELTNLNAQLLMDTILRDKTVGNEPPLHMLKLLQAEDTNFGLHVTVGINPALQVHYPKIWNELLKIFGLVPVV